MGQPVAFFEIISAGAERARGFYTVMFGWTAASDPKMGGYPLVDTNAGEGAVGAGLGPTSARGEGSSVKVYMRVGDLDACLDRANQVGLWA